MPRFSKRSLERLATCDERLQALCHEVIHEYDFTVLEGHRGKATQNAAVARGASKVRWPNSRHNKQPSLAVDIAPWPINWQGHAAFRSLAQLMKAQALKMGLDVTWGGDWKTFVDMPHYQIEGGALSPRWRDRFQTNLAAYGLADAPASDAPKPDCHEEAAAETDAPGDLGIPPELIEAMIEVESGGNPWAMRYEPGFFDRYVKPMGQVRTFGVCSQDTERVARATSWGPLQIMGQTAREIGFQGAFLSELCGETGKDWAVKYLARLKARFLKGHGWQAVVAAYNGGPGAVKGVNHFSNEGYVIKVLKAIGGAWPAE